MNDLIGQKFGRLTVIKRMDKNKWGNYRWLCECDCGEEKIIIGQNLKSGATKSCGCLNMERLTRHGHTKNSKFSKIYMVWNNMIQRCTNPKNKGYKDYGGRGITVCKSWLKFKNFLVDMGEVPKEHQLDRINNNKGYCKSNCRWTTKKQQMRNRRNNHLKIYGGKTQCLSEWAEEYQINYDLLWKRIYIYKWSIEKALTTPAQKRKK